MQRCHQFRGVVPPHVRANCQPHDQDIGGLHMSIGRRLLVAVILIAALGVPAVALAKAPVTISGDVTLTTTGASGGNRLVVENWKHME